jgi:hypothetical protein
LAIDALGYVVGGLDERLGEARASLQEALTQIRLAFVQMEAAARAAADAEPNGAGGAATTA